jgi:hypothetical protein
MDHLNKAKQFNRDCNWSQSLRHNDLALTKLKQLKDRPLEAISEALCCKCTALGFLGRHREQLECAKEWYCLWNTKPTDMGAIQAAFALIDSCIKNREYTDAHLYASTLYGIINHKYDNKIPEDQRQWYIARGACSLAQATLSLAKSGGIPPEEKQKAGERAIAAARQALEIHTLMYGTESMDVAGDMRCLADVPDVFNDVDDDEIPRLYEQSNAITSRLEGSTSVNVAAGEQNLGDAYDKRAEKANAANDLDRCMVNLELALTHYREAIRIYRAINFTDKVNELLRQATALEEYLRQIK